MKNLHLSWPLAAAGILVALLAVPQAAGPQAPAQTAAPAQSSGPATFRPVIDKYCISCHSERLKTGGLVLEGLDLAELPAHADVWEKAIRKLKGNMMPPAGAPRPDAATLTGLATSLA